MRRITRALFLTFILAGLMAGACFADIDGDNGKAIPASTAVIPIKHVIKGNQYGEEELFSFTLTAESENDPMPAGSEGKRKTITLKGEGTVDFGEMIFEYPDTYYYSVSRNDEKHDHFAADNCSYKVMIVKLSDGTVRKIIWDEKEEKADEIVFTDEYTAPAGMHSKSPKTGDAEMSVSLTVSLILFITSASVFAVIIHNRRKGRKMNNKIIMLILSLMLLSMPVVTVHADELPDDQTAAAAETISEESDTEMIQSEYESEDEIDVDNTMNEPPVLTAAEGTEPVLTGDCPDEMSDDCSGIQENLKHMAEDAAKDPEEKKKDVQELSELDDTSQITDEEEDEALHLPESWDAVFEGACN